MANTGFGQILSPQPCHRPVLSGFRSSRDATLQATVRSPFL